MPHTKRLNDTASRLAIRLPFISTIFSGMTRILDDTIGTAGVKGMVVRFSPEFMDTLDNEELMFVAAHEALHVAFLHSYRRGDRDHDLWNTAGDAVINRELMLSQLKMPLKDGKPRGVTFPWVTAEMSTEVVYQRLMQDGDQQKGGWGDSGDLEDDDGVGGDDSEAEVRVMVSQAARTAFASGDKSPLIKTLLGVVKQADVDWKDETRSMLVEAARNDYSWRRLSRRFIGQGLYLPSLYSEDLGVLGVGVDTSGSMTQKQADQIQASLRVIIEDCAPSKTIVVYCDSSINRVDTFNKGEELVIEMCGGGGTDMRKIVDYFSELEERLAGAIVFTDLETPFPSAEPDYVLLWGAVGASDHIVPPVGRKVEVKV